MVRGPGNALARLIAGDGSFRLGYFVSAAEFEECLKVRDLLPKAGFAWEMPTDLADELEKPLTPRRPSSTR